MLPPPPLSPPSLTAPSHTHPSQLLQRLLRRERTLAPHRRLLRRCATSARPAPQSPPTRDLPRSDRRRRSAERVGGRGEGVGALRAVIGRTAMEAGQAGAWTRTSDRSAARGAACRDTGSGAGRVYLPALVASLSAVAAARAGRCRQLVHAAEGGYARSGRQLVDKTSTAFRLTRTDRIVSAVRG